MENNWVWIVLVITALVAGIVAGIGYGGKEGFIKGLETGVNMISWLQNGAQQIETEEDDEE